MKITIRMKKYTIKKKTVFLPKIVARMLLVQHSSEVNKTRRSIHVHFTGVSQLSQTS